MSNNNHGTFLEAVLDQLLDVMLGHDVDVCRCFVQYYNLVLAEHCATNADELSLARAEIATACLYLIIHERIAIGRCLFIPKKELQVQLFVECSVFVIFFLLLLDDQLDEASYF